MRLMKVGVVLLTSRSKSRQKVEESSKSPKNLKGPKSCKSHRFGGTFTEVPILRQLNTKHSNFSYDFDSFLSSFCWAQELSRYHVWSDYRQGKASGAVDALSHFSREEPGRSSSWEHSSLSPTRTNGSSAPMFVYKTLILPLLKFWRCASEEDVPARDQGRDAWWLRGCRGSYATPWPVLRSWNHQNWADYRENSRTRCPEIPWGPAVASDTYSSM